jgi:hypothetical protein
MVVPFNFKLSPAVASIWAAAELTMLGNIHIQNIMTCLAIFPSWYARPPKLALKAGGLISPR